MALLYHFWQYRAYFSVRYCLRKLKLPEPELLEYRLEIDSGYFIAYEINTHIKISLFEVP